MLHIANTGCIIQQAISMKIELAFIWIWLSCVCAFAMPLSFDMNQITKWNMNGQGFHTSGRPPHHFSAILYSPPPPFLTPPCTPILKNKFPDWNTITVNSYNQSGLWIRTVAQICYYFYTGTAHARWSINICID